jgi:hypothetical protein
MLLILRRIKRVTLQVSISPSAVHIINPIFCGTLIIWTNTDTDTEISILRKYYHCNISMRADEQTDRDDEAYRRFSQFSEEDMNQSNRILTRREIMELRKECLW